ncbi:MAG: response regulator [Filimonas sp.]|nr:response regulator [Filimonas sp.]
MNENPTVLVIEDDHIMLTLTTMMLKQAGFDVIAVGNAAEAEQCVHTASYDLVVTDLLMPYGSGFALIEAVRSRTEENNTPVIVVTSFANEDTVHALSLLNVSAVLKKPLTMDGLITAVKQELATTGVPANVIKY